jgi:dUTP pyrophosphatase
LKYSNTILYESPVPYGKERIKVKYKENSPELTQTDKGGCIDLYNYNDLTLKRGEFGFIDFGIAIELPQGYDAIILPRSSTFKKYGLLLTNSAGYIDNSYNGDNDYWLGCVYATRDIQIPAGTRCFQFRLVKTQPSLQIVSVDSLGNEDRSGFGSSGD